MPLLLTAKQVAERVGAGCGVETVRKAFRDRELAGVKVGSSYGFYEHDVDAWLSSLRQEAQVSPVRVDVEISPRSRKKRSS